MVTICERIAGELSVPEHQVEAAVRLFDQGGTVPFIARYRKEATGGLTSSRLRAIDDRLRTLREIDQRRQAILKTLREQGRLDPETEAALHAAATKTEIEDIYLRYRPKRRSKATIARQAGLDALAFALVQDPTQVPEEAAAAYIAPEKGVSDVATALDGARAVLIDEFAEDAQLLAALRYLLWDRGRLQSRVVEGKRDAGAKFADYFAASEPIKNIPAHRVLAMFRGRKEAVLRLNVVLEDDVHPAGEASPMSAAETQIADHFNVRDEGRPADAWLLETVRWAWRTRLSAYVELELMNRARDEAERDAVRVFAGNLHDLLLAAPAGPRRTMGLDPGLRNGVKVAVIDEAGNVVETTIVFPHQPRNEWEPSIAVLADLMARHQVELVSIGNGTASRETDKLIAETLKRHPDLHVSKVVVSEAGASVYAASAVGARELPDLDVPLRAAVSIARRLQDPLVELVKIEPRAIGVGQYQHDVSQAHLARALNATIEDCVNAVGVNLNTASVPLLGRVAGLNRRLAANIVSYREQNGSFRSRRSLLLVPRMNERIFEQAAGFLRVFDGDDGLDATGVHPEAYAVVERIAAGTGRSVQELFGDVEMLRTLSPEPFTDEAFGVPTVRDIILELEEPGRDPRPPFRTAAFKEGLSDLGDLQPGMVLEGIVTNVANFGAFVDIGVHQDGLVHVSRLADRFVKDPREVVKAGDIVKVAVLEVDLKRKRISLSMRRSETRTVPAPSERERRPKPAAGAKPRPEKAKQQPAEPKKPVFQTTMAAAFDRLRQH
ncbi:MAG: Tex family protein [Bacteroidales bacterium]